MNNFTRQIVNTSKNCYNTVKYRGCFFVGKNPEKSKNAVIKDCTTFINMPITSDEDDKIGISQHAQEIKDAIEKGAQTIAITSDFGGGKSSLIKYLEKLYSSVTTKFCYVNLWAELKSTDSHELHRSFIYQLANQISKRKGKYVSKRLSKNYGLLKIGLQNWFMSLISYFMLAALSIGMLFIPLYDSVLIKIAGEDLFKDSHVNIGIIAFLISLLIGIFLIYKADIVFSYKDSANGSREINEHELMDIYRSYICNFHFRHYIVILEDLDRTDDTEKVLRFIRELRRYYIPASPKQFKNDFIREKVNKIIAFLRLNNRNRITFIVNIKPEYQLQHNNDDGESGIEDNDDNETFKNEFEGEKALYPKIFDYTLNIKRIHIDNYDVILTKLLEDNKELFEKNGIPVFDGEKIIPEFEWLKRGQNLNIRELKNRLNVAFSTYLNLIQKFDIKSNISLPKCIAVGYITIAFEEDYNRVEKLGFDEILDMYVKDHNLKEPLVFQYYQEKHITVSSEFAAELLRLIKAELISFDYKQYFYNYPIGSYLRTNDENKLLNVLLYDFEVPPDELERLVKNALDSRSSVINNAYDRLNQLNLNCPKCIFQSDSLMQYSLKQYQPMVMDTLCYELQYDNQSMPSTSRILTEIIKKHLLDNQELIDEICNYVVSKANPQGIIIFRKEILNSLMGDISKFSSLYATDTPLITKQEASDLNDENVFSFINYNSTDFTIDFVNHIHSIIMRESFNISSKNTLDSLISFYSHTYEVLGETENAQLTSLMFEFMTRYIVMPSELEDLIILNNGFDDIKSKYIALVNLYGEHNELSENTILILDDNNVVEGLSETSCNQLFQRGFIKLFIVNAVSTNPQLINISDELIQQTILDIDFYDEEDAQTSEELLLKLRMYIIQNDIDLAIKEFSYLFSENNCLIKKDELQQIDNKVDAIKLINPQKIAESDVDYISSYLSDSLVDQNETFTVLYFVASLPDPDVKKLLFIELDFDHLQYYRISKARKESIKTNLSDAFDFSSVPDMFLFMQVTKTSDEELEKKINKAIKNGNFSNFESQYIKYVKSVKTITIYAINNVCAFDSCYPFPQRVLDKLFDFGKYKYYIISKSLTTGYFSFEKGKLNELKDTYISLFLSVKTDEEIFKLMLRNTSFLEMLVQENSFLGLDEKKRIYFASVPQTESLLQDLSNYSTKFQILYLSGIEGFKDEPAATYYVQMMNLNPVLGSNQILYDHNHEKLVSPSLKRTYTKIHKR